MYASTYRSTLPYIFIYIYQRILVCTIHHLDRGQGHLFSAEERSRPRHAYLPSRPAGHGSTDGHREVANGGAYIDLLGEDLEVFGVVGQQRDSMYVGGRCDR